MVILLGLAATICTLLGGLFALRFKDKLHLILGFSAGAVIGVAFFDLMPEAIELAGNSHSIGTITSFVALGFVLYMLIDRLVALHFHSDDLDVVTDTAHKGHLGAGSFSTHSLLDGIAIGLAFQVSAIVGAVVAIAVLVHDFSDGINTVSLILKNGGSKSTAFKWLMADAVAPFVGVISTIFFTVKEESLGILLALFCGFFLYIGASDLLPESHHSHPTVWSTVTAILGMAVLYGAITLAQI